MQYIDTLEDAKKLVHEDEELGRRVYDDVATLLESYDLQSLEQGNCSYGGCVMIAEMDEVISTLKRFKGLDLSMNELADVFVCSNGQLCIRLLYIYSDDYAVSCYITSKKRKS